MEVAFANLPVLLLVNIQSYLSVTELVSIDFPANLFLSLSLVHRTHLAYYNYAVFIIVSSYAAAAEKYKRMIFMLLKIK